MSTTPVILSAANDNDGWEHASSLEAERLRADRMGELAFMKELFATHLPVGKNKEEIDKYFMDLEKVIYTTDYHKIKNDVFPELSDGECCCGTQHDDSVPADHKCERREYKYFSADLLKQQALDAKCDRRDADEYSDLCVDFSGYVDECVEEVPDPADYRTPFRLGKVQAESSGSGHCSRLA
jgi:hypothetical protein